MKVSKSNFRPPPKVESSIVRVEPRNPRPNINFIEWDGLLRIVFSRKNKTLGSIFKTKSVIKLLFENYKTFKFHGGLHSTDPDEQANQKDEEIILEDDIGEDNDNDEPELEDDLGDENDKDGKTQTSSELIKFKEYLEGVIHKSHFEKERSSKLSPNDFLEILSYFNKNDIHFK